MVIEPNELCRLLSYDPVTGGLLWKERDGNLCHSEGQASRFNKRYAGTAALNWVSSTSGYRYGCIRGKKIEAHRVAWAMYYGAWPSGEIDHIDGNRTNNAIRNLRDVTRAENLRNAGIRKDNVSGAPGVRMVGRKWQAYIFSGARRQHLGTFETRDDAVNARQEAERAHGFSGRWAAQ